MGDLDSAILPFEASKLKHPDYMGGSHHVEYILGYLEEMGAQTCIIEWEYIDKDFTIDYQKFYCRSFKEPNNKKTKRIHFFNIDINPSTFRDYINTKTFTEIKDENHYLGFVIIRPIKDETGHPLVGRTLLKTYPSLEDDKIRIFITHFYQPSLFGVQLKIASLPFQAKDRGVSACATIALWSAIHPLKDSFGVVEHSPAEITEMATSLPSFHRRFPSSGLTKEQMINYIKLLGLDVEIIKPKKVDIIPLIIKAYINNINEGLPIIASLKMNKKKTSEEKGEKTENGDANTEESELIEEDANIEKRHAVVITGYQTDEKGNILKLYVHDDEIGPYCKVEPKGDGFLEWDYEMAWSYDVKLEDLEIPMYPKVRTTFPRMLAEYLRAKKKMNDRLKSKFEEQLKTHYQRNGVKIDDKDIDDNVKKLLLVYSMDLFLTPVRDYKNYILSQEIEQKLEFLMKPLPKYLWVIRFCEKNIPRWDYIYDTTSVYAVKLDKLRYINTLQR